MQRKSSINLHTGPLSLWLKTKLLVHRRRFHRATKEQLPGKEQLSSQGFESRTATQAQPVVWVPTNQSRDIMEHLGHSIKTPERPHLTSRVEIALDKTYPRSALMKL